MTEQFIGKKKLSLSLLIKIVKDTGQGFIDDSVTRLSGSLAYATLFSIIPFLSLLVTIGVALHMDLANQLYIQLEPIVGAEVIGALRLIIENAERTDSSASAAIVSLGISIFGATTIFAELSFSIILVFAFVLLITFSITNIIGDLSNKFMASYPEVAGFIVKVVGQVLNIGVTVIIFVLIFKVLPDAKIKSKDVVIGAVVTTVLLLIGQWGISFYIGIANVGTIYGAAAFMVVFITWIYYSAIIVYAGAEFTKAWANEMGSKIFPDEYAVATKVVEIRET